jgi:hypothetical protein
MAATYTMAPETSTANNGWLPCNAFAALSTSARRHGKTCRRLPACRVFQSLQKRGNSNVTVRLRAHHLLCMLTFIGKGYTPEFTENYRRIAARLSAGETIELVNGPDDICAPLSGFVDKHCLQDSVTDRDEKAAMAVSKLLGRSVVKGSVITPDADVLKRLRQAFRAGDIRAGCARCEWSPLCTDVADKGFPDVLVGSTGLTE